MCIIIVIDDRHVRDEIGEENESVTKPPSLKSYRRKLKPQNGDEAKIMVKAYTNQRV